MSAIDPKYIARNNFDKSIEICKKNIDRFKGKENEKKYQLMLKELESAKKKLNEAIEKSRSIKMKDDKTFYESFVQGNETVVTLAWLGDKINAEREKGEIAEDQSVDLSTQAVDVHYDFVEKTKKAGKDLLNGKGISKGVINALFGICIGELLTKGVTSLLVKKGIMSESMGLVGLAKLGIANLPKVWAAIKTGLAAAWNFSALSVIGVGALGLAIAIPKVKHLIDKTKKKCKEANEFENNINEMINSQATLAI